MNVPLTPQQIQDLRNLVAHIIPSAVEYCAPGADDEVIFQDILRNIGRDAEDVAASLNILADLCKSNFSDLDLESQSAVIPEFRAMGGQSLEVLVRLILLCYYRDDRVMVSIGLEPRAPFPNGHRLPQGDWSLLDAVRTREPFYRKVMVDNLEPAMASNK